MTVTRIRGRSTYNHEDGYREEDFEFTLGKGSCGKEVTFLSAYANGDFLVVNQVTSDKEVKTFYYPGHRLCGRVEVTETPAN